MSARKVTIEFYNGPSECHEFEHDQEYFSISTEFVEVATLCNDGSIYTHYYPWRSIKKIETLDDDRRDI